MGNILNKLKIVVWNVGFIDMQIEDFLQSNGKYHIEWMKHSYNDRFFADPFLLNEDEKNYIILAEEYLFSEGKGRIVRLTVDKKSKMLRSNERLIDTKYHLSYPFVYNDEIIVEQQKSGKWISYDKTGKKRRIVAELGLIDATILNDGENEWVFATRIVKEKAEALRKLYRYKLIDGKVDNDSEMLVKENLIASRPAGNFFKINDSWYRAAQTSTETVYGESVSICKIIENNENEFAEKPVMVVNSHNEKRFNLGMHTFNPYKRTIIVDGFEMQSHPLQKVQYRLSIRQGKK